MKQPIVEVADIFQRYGPTYRERQGSSLSRSQRRGMGAIACCRTAALGGHVEACDHCGHERIAYNSCRNRHCPKCQALAKTQWLEARQAERLPTAYYHVVLTLPQEIAAIAYQNQAVGYGLLFRTAAATLRTIAGDPKYLGAQIGFTAVLHTWGQPLLYPPHLQCVVPGGGLTPDGERWIACRPGFFLPVRVLSRLFRRLFLEGLQQAFETKQLPFFSTLAPLKDAQRFVAYLTPVRDTEWVVYAQRPFGTPRQVLAYLGRYTPRVAIANPCLGSMEDGLVSFRWKDYRHHHKQNRMTLAAEEFIRRCLLHVLPAGFQRIRHYGFLSNWSPGRKTRSVSPTLRSAAPTAFLLSPAPGLSGAL